MSVPVHKRSESSLSFLVNAEKLQQITGAIVMNEKYVPKKYRYIWTKEVFRLSMNIYENVRRANILYPRDAESLKARLYHLTKAETDSEALLSQISYARKNFNIPSGLLKDWEKKCTDTKHSIRRRRNSDFETHCDKMKNK